LLPDLIAFGQYETTPFNLNGHPDRTRQILSRQNDAICHFHDTISLEQVRMEVNRADRPGAAIQIERNARETPEMR
jgi:hypothetical protein